MSNETPDTRFISVELLAATALRILASLLEHHADVIPLETLRPLLEIIPLASRPSGDYTVHQWTMSREEPTKMIETVPLSATVSLLRLNSPWRYHTLHCLVCNRDWIAEPKKGEEVYNPPARCTYRDCRSPYWSDKEKAPLMRIDWQRRQQSTEGTIRESATG